MRVSYLAVVVVVVVMVAIFLRTQHIPGSGSLPPGSLGYPDCPINVGDATPTAVHTQSLSSQNLFFDAAFADIRDLGSTTSIAETSPSKCVPYLEPQRRCPPTAGPTLCEVA